MNIFIDESGKFEALESLLDKPSYEPIVAIILNDSGLSAFEEKYRNWSKETSRRNAKEIIDFIDQQNGNVFIVILDANFALKPTLELHRIDWVRSIIESSKDHPYPLCEDIRSCSTALPKLSYNQYIKSLLMIRLLENILRGVCFESTQFAQHNLHNFKVISDNFGINSEAVIKEIVFFAIFCNASKNPVTVDNKELLKHLIDSSGKYLNANLVFKNIDFSESKNSIGIRIADVVANQIFRIMNEAQSDFDPAVWQRLCSSPYSCDFMHFDKDKEFIENPIGEAADAFVKACSLTSRKRDNHSKTS